MRLLRWWREAVGGSAPRLRKAAWLAGLVLGLAAEGLARPGQGLAAAGADLAVGWALIGCGLVGWSRRPQSRVGPLLALTGFAWFAGTLAGSRIGVLPRSARHCFSSTVARYAMCLSVIRAGGLRTG